MEMESDDESDKNCLIDLIQISYEVKQSKVLIRVFRQFSNSLSTDIEPSRVKLCTLRVKFGHVNVTSIIFCTDCIFSRSKRREYLSRHLHRPQIYYGNLDLKEGWWGN